MYVAASIAVKCSAPNMHIIAHTYDNMYSIKHKYQYQSVTYQIPHMHMHGKELARQHHKSATANTINNEVNLLSFQSEKHV